MNPELLTVGDTVRRKSGISRWQAIDYGPPYMF